MADHPLKPAIDRSLGRPLPHQLTNLTRAHPIASAFKKRHLFVRRPYSVLIRISPGYPQLLGRFPRVTHPSATRHLEQAPMLPFDLHVLGIPPAFNLSQDQTLQLIVRANIKSTLITCGNSKLQSHLFDLTILSKKLRDIIWSLVVLYLKYINPKRPHKLSIYFLIYLKQPHRHFVQRGAILSLFKFLLQAFS